MGTAFQEVDEKTLKQLTQRVEEAIEFNLALSPDDYQLLLNALLTLMQVQQHLANREITLQKLRKLLGIVCASEAFDKLFPKTDSDDSSSDHKKADSAAPGNNKSRSKKSDHQQPAAPKIKPEVMHHGLNGLNQGDPCPECHAGRVYGVKPAALLRISGHSPYEVIEHIRERMRCNSCGAYFTAELPDTVLDDGHQQQRYGYSARALITFYKCFAGLPYYRQGTVQSVLGLPISPSTQFDQVEQVANDLFPVLRHLKQMAANGVLFYLDDTTNRIIDQQPILKKKRHSDQMQLRTGVYTSGMIIESIEGLHITLFQTSIGHAGEFIDETLSERVLNLPPPLLMSDALSSNTPTVCKVAQAYCNAHGRRQFVDVINQFPNEVEWVLRHYQLIWRYDDETEQQQMTPAERLRYHRTHSLPVMKSIQQWGADQLVTGKTEENSGLGKAIRYFNKHFEGLILFCRKEGVPLDNNKMERQLKIIIRNRKNALFFKTPAGAAIYDCVTSVIATAINYDINVWNYLTALQRFREQVRLTPEKWLPWNYEENLKCA